METQKLRDTYEEGCVLDVECEPAMMSEWVVENP